MQVDLPVLERWLTGWSLSRGLPPPGHRGGGLVVEVGWPAQLRRHVFVDAGPALQECARHIHEPFIYLKAAVDADRMRLALPGRWQIESPGYLMACPAPMAGPARAPAPAGHVAHVYVADVYVAHVAAEHGAAVIRFADASGHTAATGRVSINGATAVFDRIETLEPHRRKGLGSAVMRALDALAAQAGVSERLLVATEAGRELYLSLGWRVAAPYSTAVLPAP
jgi:GNAT superfamily N-acetyltransferase